jgi:hypothetical protein
MRDAPPQTRSRRRGVRTRVPRTALAFRKGTRRREDYRTREAKLTSRERPPSQQRYSGVTPRRRGTMMSP